MTEFTQTAILQAATEVKGYVEAYGALPVYITVTGVLVNRADFLRMMVVVTRWINTNNSSEYDYTPGVYKNAPNPTESLKTGNIQRTEYVGAPGTDPSESIAKRISNFMDGAVAPNYSNSSLGTISFYNLIYMFARILAWYQKTGYLPAYSAVTAKTYTDNIVSSYPAEYKQYLVATNNCQVDNPVIVNIANTLNGGGKVVFTYVRDEIEYDFYYNTLRGAVRTAQEKVANCCDDAHLNVALARAKGLPARYVHSTAVTFDTITCGHVWAEIYENGKWNKADGSNNNNEYGVNPLDSRIPATAIVTRYATLPF